MRLLPVEAVAIWPLVPARSFDSPLTWLVPDELAGQLRVGTIVEMPMAGRARVGVVAELDVDAPDGVQLKHLSRVIDVAPVPADLVDLATWIADQYGCARTVALSLVVSPKLAAQARATAVPTRRRQQAVRRIAPDLEGVDLTRRQRAIAEGVTNRWTALADVVAALATTRSTLGKLAEAGVLSIEERFLDEMEEQPDDDGVAGQGVGESIEMPGVVLHAGQSGVTLTPAQLAAVDACAAVGERDPGTVLVGVTGSGKTEVYLELIARSLDAGRDAIVLVPEIALTPQTSRRFLRRFPGLVEVLHSGMTKAQRAAAYERIAKGAARVVVGPRSAIFAPLANLGVIVIDEEHDGSYKQDSDPRYDARRVAYRRAAATSARVVFGSATPRPESWHGVRRRALLLDRPGGGRLAPVELIDLREHEDDFPLTMPVRRAIEQTLARGRKAIVLHNRRGYATALHCRGCGHTFRCPHCDVTLVIHGHVARRQRISCHHCGHDEPVPPRCPACNAADVARMGAGTERIESLLGELFDVPIFRLDADATRTRGSVGEILQSFADAGPSVLAGTQMVAKGHDFPDVELAVVVDADAALAIPDFRAEERAFSLVAQLAGRAGRSAQTAEHARVLVQTWDPEHAFLAFAKTHDVEGFLARELGHREELDYPPFTRIVRVLVSAPSEAQRDRWAATVGDGMRRLGAGRVLGPAPLMRINDRERSQVLVKTHSAASVASAVRNFLGTSEAQRRKADVRIALDVDPQALV